MHDPADLWDGWQDELMEDLPTVCVQHLRFIPCRVEKGCQLSTHPDAVTAVRNFQQNWR